MGTKERQSLVASFPKWTSGLAHVRGSSQGWEEEGSGVPHGAPSQVGLRGEGVQDTPWQIMGVQCVHFLQE